MIYKAYLDYIKKYLKYIITVYIIIELAIFLKIGTHNVFTFLGSLFIVMLLLISCVLMMKDFETNIFVFTLIMPLLPMVMYLAKRMSMLWIGEGIYFVFLFIFVYNFIVNVNKSKFDFSKVSFKGKYKHYAIIYLVMMAISLVSIILSVHKAEAFYIIFLSMIVMGFFCFVLLSYKYNTADMYQKIILCLCCGVVLSGIPDGLVTIFYMITKNANEHLYSVLGSNFMLGYSLIVIPIIFLNAVNKNISKKYNNIYKLLVIIECIILATQMSRGIFLSLFICFILLMVIDKKNWYKYLIIGIVVLSCIGFNVMHRWEMSDVEEDIKNQGIEKTVVVNIFKKGSIINRFIQQTTSRRPIWAVSIKMISDNPIFGVGPGHFKYNYVKYGGNPDKLYTDGHNIFMQIMCELGIPFTLIFACLIFYVIIKASLWVKKYKNNEINKLVLAAVIGILGLVIYGTITGQAFISMVYPVSITPAFTFTVIMTFLLLYLKEYYKIK